jgi:hemerythrin-like domain-containing protein
MKPVGPLMWEHRLIERMISLLDKELKNISRGTPPDTEFLSVAVDFIRFYADRTHHGKEEDILFRELAKKQLFPEHKKIMDELVKEHVFARNTVKKLAAAKDSYLQGDKNSVDTILSCLSELVNLYPEHIYKEDKHFFFPVLDYFTGEEHDTMLAEFREFDRKLVYEKYKQIVENLEAAGK